MHRYRHAILLISLATATIAAAQPCADWSDTMGPPRILPHPATEAMAHGDHVLAIFQTLRVLDPQTEDHDLVGECGFPASANPRRPRQVGGNAYVACGQAGILRVDLTDPANPALVAAYVPGTEITDMAAFAGGVVLVAEGVLSVFDAVGGNLLGEITVGADRDRVVAEGTVAVVWGEGDPGVVDLTNPAAPLITDVRPCLPEGDLTDPVVYTDLFLVDQTGYAVVTYGGDRSLEAFDASDPANPIGLSCLPLSEPTQLLVSGDWLVTQDAESIVFRDQGDLSELGSIAYHSSPGPGDLLTFAGDRLLFSSFYYALHELDLAAPYPIRPLAEMADEYDPAGCGPFGQTQYDEHVSPDEFIRHFVYHDQSDPLNPVELRHEQYPIGDGDDHVRRSIVAQDDRWAVILDATGPGQGAIDLVDRQGEIVSLYQNVWVTVALADGVLWIAGAEGDAPAPAELLSFDISGDTPVELQSMAIDGRCFHVTVIDDWLVFTGSAETGVFDISDPAVPIPLGGIASTETGPAFPVPGLPGHFLNGGAAGLSLYELTPDDAIPLRRRSTIGVALDAARPTVIGDHVVVGDHEHRLWWVVSLADPDNPVTVSPILEDQARGFVWSEPHLYVDTDYAVLQYDITDPANPVYLGQSGVNDSDTGLCRLGQVLMNDGWVLPLDCDDIVAVDDPETEDDPVLPAARGVVLHAATPNPFNPRTSLSFDLADPTRVTLSIHDLRGRRVATVADGHYDAGRHVFTWHGVADDGRALPSGGYLVRLESEGAIRTTKAVLVR